MNVLSEILSKLKSKIVIESQNSRSNVIKAAHEGYVLVSMEQHEKSASFS